MFRRAFLIYLPTLIAILYLVCAAGIIIRSYFIQDILIRFCSDDSTFGITTEPGAVVFCHIRPPPAETETTGWLRGSLSAEDLVPVWYGKLRYDVKPAQHASPGTPPDIGSLNVAFAMYQPIRNVGAPGNTLTLSGHGYVGGFFSVRNTVLSGRAVQEAWGGFEFWSIFHPMLDDPKTGLATTRIWVVPAWMLLAPPLLPLGLFVRRWVIRRRLRRAAVPGAIPCRVCGYDLRATPDRCPECGAVVKQT